MVLEDSSKIPVSLPHRGASRVFRHLSVLISGSAIIWPRGLVRQNRARLEIDGERRLDLKFLKPVQIQELRIRNCLLASLGYFVVEWDAHL